MILHLYSFKILARYKLQNCEHSGILIFQGNASRREYNLISETLKISTGKMIQLTVMFWD